MSKAKSFLQSAYYTERRIESKREQIESLRSLAMSTTQTVSDMPGSPTRNIDKMEKNIIKANDLIAELEDDIANLLDRKVKVRQLINTLDDPKQILVLESRYLLYESWNEIASEMHYSTQNMFKVHDEAVKILNDRVDGFRQK